jgi:hypothetical protein
LIHEGDPSGRPYPVIPEGVIPVLIRSIEIQDSFVRAPVQGARQLSLDLTRPDLQHRQMAQVAAEQHVVDQNRPTASERPEEHGIDPNSRPTPDDSRKRRRGRRGGSPGEEEKSPPHVSTTGTRIDFTA